MNSFNFHHVPKEILTVKLKNKAHNFGITSSKAKPKKESLTSLYEKYISRRGNVFFKSGLLIGSLPVIPRNSDSQPIKIEDAIPLSMELIWRREFRRTLEEKLFSDEYSNLLYKKVFEPKSLTITEKHILKRLDTTHSRLIKKQEKKLFETVDRLSKRNEVIDIFLKQLKSEN